MTQHRVALLTGSNHPCREQILQQTRLVVEQRIGEVVGASAIYHSEAWGFRCEEPFANQALIVSTVLDAEQVLQEALAIEQEIGRDRAEEQRERERTGERYASRIIDIDVIFYDRVVWQSPTLTIPHPLMQQRAFVLEPLAEVAAEWRHPVTGRSVEQMWQDIRCEENEENKI